ncbi:hypothetical protein F8388_002345 [Cannabis sativa]|uniref:Uncharacterized protein n=1 Tax=Cannabis sativa TaxID=3483 RepID=A0A7J6EX28_CANSA|nr:hypothetical protein F8388_002345 [Cannabis sativa]
MVFISVKIASECLNNRVFEIFLAYLQKVANHAYWKICLRVEDVQGKNVLTKFWVRERRLVCKWQTLIKAHVDVKTTDIAFTEIW